MHIVKWKKPTWKPYKLLNTTVPFWKRKNYGDRTKIRGCQEFVDVCGERWLGEDEVEGVFNENILWDIVMVERWHAFITTPYKFFPFQFPTVTSDF